MKTFLIPAGALLGMIFLLSSFGGGNDVKYPNGAPAGYSGSPADGKNCTFCHGGTASNTAGYITSNVPSLGYTGGSTYLITVSVPGDGNKGFEVSPQKSNGNLMGSLAAGPNTIIKDSKYVTHHTAGTDNPSVWTFTWTAPGAGSGPVTFYGAFANSLATTKLSTLVIAENHAGVTDRSDEMNFTIFPNPVHECINLSYTLNQSLYISLTLHDLSGKFLRTLVSEMQPAGENKKTICLDGSLKSGIYLVSLSCGNSAAISRKLIIK
jgi:hypothetical protein